MVVALSISPYSLTRLVETPRPCHAEKGYIVRSDIKDDTEWNPNESHNKKATIIRPAFLFSTALSYIHNES